jgi:hypothetical protein
VCFYAQWSSCLTFHLTKEMGEQQQLLRQLLPLSVTPVELI